MNKTVIIINGRGGAGKDTLCNIAARSYKVQNISAITPIKDIAMQYGWNGEKDIKSRRFLSDLKRTFTNYNDLPTRYLLQKYEEFLESPDQILFMHIREAAEIEKIKKRIAIKCVTLLVRREADCQEWGNDSDDRVEQYEYDFYYDNDKTLSKTEKDFTELLRKIYDSCEWCQNGVGGTKCIAKAGGRC